MKYFRLIVLVIVLLANNVIVWGQAAPPVDRLSVKEKLVAVTVEDIGTAEELKQIMTLCSRYQAGVTFFIEARELAKYGDLIKQAIGMGHEFGNYGMEHRYWGEVPSQEIRRELAAAGEAVRAVTGRTPDVYIPPYHYYEAAFMDAAAQISPGGIVVRGKDLTDWTLSSKEGLVEKALNGVESGSIIQLNYKTKYAAEALGDILEQLAKQGYGFTTVSALREKSAGRIIKTPPAIAKPSLRDGYYGVIHHINTRRPAVALTFDDGGSPARVTAILDVLQLYQAKATFFLLGSWVNEHPDLVRRMQKEGHELANHSYSHARFSWLSEAEIRSELESTQTALAEASGQPAAPLFRPPYGSYNAKVMQIVKEMGYQALVMWDIDTRDWSGREGTVIREQVLEEVNSGSIVLFHLHAEHTAQALAELIPSLQQRGYRLSTVGEMLAGR